MAAIGAPSQVVRLRSSREWSAADDVVELVIEKICVRVGSRCPRFENGRATNDMHWKSAYFASWNSLLGPDGASLGLEMIPNETACGRALLSSTLAPRVWEQIWEQYAVKPARITATARQP